MHIKLIDFGTCDVSKSKLFDENLINKILKYKNIDTD